MATIFTGARPIQGAADTVTLFPSTTVAANANTNTTATNIGRPDNAMVFVLDITNAANAATDTLDVKVQCTIDATNWCDICYFTQVLGNGGAKRYFAKCIGNATQAMADGNTALTAGNTRNLFGDQYRVNYVAANNNAMSFTFSVSARPM